MTISQKYANWKKHIARQSVGEMRMRLEIRSRPKYCFPARKRFVHILKAV